MRLSQVTFHHPKLRTKVTLIPMLHIACPEFYDEISNGLNHFDYLLLEGVKWNSIRHGLYDLAARDMELAAQEKRLRLPQDVRCIRLDMTSEEFQQSVKQLPFKYRIFLFFMSPLIWLLTRIPEVRAWILGWSSRDVLDRSYEDTPLNELIQSKRDKAMANCLQAFLDKQMECGERFSAAAITGASHIPALYGVLRENGYCLGSAKWIRVLGDHAHKVRDNI